MTEEPSALERRYRAVLRLLPAEYRAVWADEMVATFLAGMHSDDPGEAELIAELGRPSWSEVFSVVALALRVRLGGADASPQSYRWGEAVRFAVRCVLLAHAVTALLSAFALLWLARAVPWLPAPRNDRVLVAANLAGLLWAGAFLTLLSGRVAVTRTLAAAAYVLGAICLAIELFHDPPSIGAWANLVVLDGLLLIGLAAFGPETPPVPRRPWLIAVGIGGCLLPGLVFLIGPSGAGAPLLDWPGLCAAAVVVTAVVQLSRRQAPAARTLGVALLATAAFGLRAVTMLGYVQFVPGAERTRLLVSAVAEAAALLAVVVLLVGGARRADQARLAERG